jgi:uncharacterized surface protein with fasciclin (FAS1) repeats
MLRFPHRTLLAAAFGIGLATTTTLVSPAQAQQPEMGRVVASDAFTYTVQDPKLTVWAQLIGAGGLENAARTAVYTVFPAADSAFDQFPGMVQDLLGYQMNTGTHHAGSTFPDTSRIVKLVRSHAVAGKLLVSELMGKKVTLTTIAGTELDIDATDPKAVRLHWVSVANGQPLDATLVEPPVTTTNAVIYVVNKIDKM